MSDINRVVLHGRLTHDPEVRYTANGNAVCTLRLASNHKYGDKEETLYISAVVWKGHAEACGKYLSKGRAVLIDGRLVYRTWEKDGRKRSTIEINAEKVQFIGGGARGSDEGRVPNETPVAGAESGYGQDGGQSRWTDGAPGDDDIPF